MAELENQNIESLDSNTYEIIQKRLQSQKSDLIQRLNALNDDRKEIFTSVDLKLIANQRITTENNCTARGIIAFDTTCIFAYNVHFGLKTDIQLSDVFSIYRFENDQFLPQPLDFIYDENFISDYKNLYKYYRDSIFSRFKKTENYLYMVFQTSKNADNLKAFKWLIKDNQLIYQDDRSIHEVVKSPQFEFNWIKTNLENRRLGVHPHVSIQDKVFIEAVGGDITFKIEDNTDNGQGIYSEPVKNADQQLDDADYFYADLGNFIAIRIKPYQEDFRAFIFNNRTKQVINVPALNETGILLPDGQGILFSNGYYLQNGDYKIFDNSVHNLEFVRTIPSHNGEDYLYLFYQAENNIYTLMSYNIIKQQVETPIVCSGFTLFNDGKLIYFRSENEAVRHHVVQIWETPYAATLIENKEQKENHLYKIGNKDIVKAMAECQEIIHLIDKEDSYEGLYGDIAKKANDIIDAYFWIRTKETKSLDEPLEQIRSIANTAIDEFEKVQEQRKRAAGLLTDLKAKVDKQLFNVKNAKGDTLEGLVHLLAENRKLLGEVISARQTKYVDLTILENYQEQLGKTNESLSDKTIAFLLQEQALVPYEQKVVDQKAKVNEVVKVIDANAIDENCKAISAELELLIDILNSLKIEDTTQATKIIEKISVIFASLNEVRSQLKRKIDSLRTNESIAEFHAQLTLLDQSIINFLELSNSPEKCDEYHSKVSVQVEELESKFADFDDFILKIADKREEVSKAFDTRKTKLVEQINRRTSSLEQIGLRILKNIENKSSSFKTKEEILAFFSTDLMVDKVRQLVIKLNDLGDVSKAENLENSVKTSQEDALRTLRDKQDLFADGENVISLGTHKFLVNKQPLDLTIVRRNDILYYHLTGTSFTYPIHNDKIYAYKEIWNQDIISENNEVYRAEYLAYQIIQELRTNPSLDINEAVKFRTEQNYSEGYLKGVHDFDGLEITQALLKLKAELGILTYAPAIRVSAQVFWYKLEAEVRESLLKNINSAAAVQKVFPSSTNYQYIINQLEELYAQWQSPLRELAYKKEVANYIFEEFSSGVFFTKAEQASILKKQFVTFLQQKNASVIFENDINDTTLSTLDAFYLIQNWLYSYIDNEPKAAIYKKYIDEACCLLLFEKQYNYTLKESTDTIILNNLKGNHALIVQDTYTLDYHEYMHKLEVFETERVPMFTDFIATKDMLLSEYKKSLKVNELKPRVLTSFVRNKLINEVYFPLIGNNLAKQIGVYGDNKRTARMGMLLLVSPPGYGKTTLMEYLANALGLHFVKINGPTIGHSITSIDPTEAKTSGAREELKKINLSFEMADNVMLYLDDIQHCSSEFLQKFISLADGQRKMDGIFEGESKTYDLRGKRFCIIMAGNPYTESGEKFQIPDMLANRADTYNLGDVIGSTEHLFKLSLLENAIAENTYLQKLSSNSLDDFYKLINHIETKSEESLSLEGNFSGQEIEEFTAVLKKSITVRDIVLKVNQQYILSASMDNAYRTEPAFKLQGSYRDMNKMMSRIVPLMNDSEIDELILTHYENESQTLTSDTEANLLKLKELANRLTDVERKRWEDIKDIFIKQNKLGMAGKDNQVAQVLGQLMDFNQNLESIAKAIKK
ncbi:DNA repair ATPase [Myroides odoratimimus]|uniref:DNA repair ATPase n=1 Tax=Myroides odoratimimus TaxID=76832 RepID=UPI003100B8D4